MTQQWISVKDRLPDVEYGNAEQFIVNSHVSTAPIKDVTMCAAWYKGHFYNLEYLHQIDFGDGDKVYKHRMITVSHWMPLPAPPGSEPDSGPVSSSTPCSFNVENPDRVTPL